MTPQQRRAIEILNDLKRKRLYDGCENNVSVMSDDDYFFLLDIIIDKPDTITIPQPYPVYPWQQEPIQPYYLREFTTTCKKEK